MTSTQPARPLVLPGGDEEVRLTVHTEIPGAVQAWGRVIASAMTRDADSDDPFTLTSLTLVGRVYDGRLREALLDIADMQAEASALSPRRKAIDDVLAVLTKIQPVDDGTQPDPEAEPPAAPHPPITIDTVHLLSRLANAVMHGRRVRFRLNEGDAVLKGELRQIVRPDSIALLPGDADPRDGRVRITVDLGVEYLLPVTDVLDMIVRTEFGIED